MTQSFWLFLAVVALVVVRNHLDAFVLKSSSSSSSSSSTTRPTRTATTTRTPKTLYAFMGGVGAYFDSFASPGNDDDANDDDDTNKKEDKDTNDRENLNHNYNRDDSNDDPIDYERYKAALEHNTRRTDVRLFLTQRAMQSFINLLITCRDPHTVRWLENMYHFSNLEKYHGTGAFNLTKYGAWDSILLDMLQQPDDVVIVSARRRGRGHGGWSKDNPFLEDRFVEFEIEIEPPSLVTRILSVRQQIAQEWVTDLATLQTVNGQILDSYHTRTSQMRDEEEECVADNDSGNPLSHEEECGPADTMHVREQSGGAAFDRNAGYYMVNKITEELETSGRTSSQLRQGNFDLLALLATQEALHRVLRDYQQTGDERSVSHQWLKQFYTNRLRRYFDGDGEWHRADDFLQELLSTPPSTVELSGSGSSSGSSTQTQIGLVDPLRIAQDLLQTRTHVIDEWQAIMRDEVSRDHMELQKSILAVRMGKTLEPPSASTAGAGNNGGGIEGSSSSGGVFGQGAFE